jgi:hypothetical protein
MNAAMLTSRADNSLNQARPIALSGRLTTLRDRIGGSDRHDFYRFRLAAPSQLQLSLQSPGANLTLLNRTGKRLQRGRAEGTATTLQTPLQAGTYYLQVSPHRGRQARYRLTASATPNRTASVAANSSFNIEFDYRFDTTGWFTPEKRAALDAAASFWENIIQDEFANVPTGTQVQALTNPATGETIRNFANDRPIDDVVIFVGAKEAKRILAKAIATATPALVPEQKRYGGADFEPWVGSIAFNPTINWFFDPTPATVSDLPAKAMDFISIATHEIGHILGFGSSEAYDTWVETAQRPYGTVKAGAGFVGPSAKAFNGGQPIPLGTGLVAGHIADKYQFGGSGTPLMVPYYFEGQRRLPTKLDAAILDDIGYTINYAATFQNPA